MRSTQANLRLGITAMAVLAVLCLSGCDPSRKKGDLSERVEMDGYSFLPPADSGWLIASRTADAITLFKPGVMDGQTYLIEAGHLALDELGQTRDIVAFTDKTHKNLFPQPRFRILEHDLSSAQISGAQCALSHSLVEDRDPGTTSNVVSALHLEAVGTICIHPVREDLGVRMTYTHRAFPEDRDRGFEALAESMLQTQQFSRSEASP